MDFFPLFLKQRNHRVGRVRIKLRAVRFLNPANVSSKFDRRDLHAETKPEIGDSMLARVTRRFNFPFHAALTKSAGNQNAGDIFQLCADAVLERFRINQFQIDPAILARRGMSE